MTRIVCLTLGLVSLCSCATPYFQGPEAVRQQIAAHEQAYQAVADEWADGAPRLRSFCYFPDVWYTRDNGEAYRWGEGFIRAVRGGYHVTGVGQGRLLLVPTFREAAQLAGTTVDELGRWTQISSDLHIYCINNIPGDADIIIPRYVEIMLRGSDAVPYGVRYVPPDQEKTYAAMREVSGQRFEVEDTAFTHLFGRWFYFRSRR